MSTGRSYACRHLSPRGPMLRPMIAAILTCTVTCCTNWKPVPVQPETYIRTHHPESIWVQLQDSSAFLLGRPRVSLDTLRGIDAGTYRRIPLRSVARLRAPEPAVARTALLVTFAVVASAAVIYWAASSDRTQP